MSSFLTLQQGIWLNSLTPQRLNSSASYLLPFAFGAQPFKYIVHAIKLEACGQRHHWYRQLFKAERAVAMFAVKVRVLVLHGAVAIVCTHGVFQRARPIVDGVNEPVEQEKRECSRDGAFVYRG